MMWAESLYALKLSTEAAIMYFEQFYLGCLAHASYMLASEGEAIVVDPQRDVDIYLKAAEEHERKDPPYFRDSSARRFCFRT